MVDVVDLFSGGGGGWCLAARALGLVSVGIEWDAPSCLTRAAAGLLTVRADVASYPPERFAGVVGLTGGPPCQSFSAAGMRKDMADPRGQLVHEPMRWVRAVRPRWVALEQVPEVLVYWRSMAAELRELGYSAWAGILNTADYGVPQIRKRAILLASLDRQVQPPEPTHSQTGGRGMFGPALLPWVSMADALGWDGRLLTQTNTGGSPQHPEDRHPYECGTDRPAPTILGNSGGRWQVKTHHNGRVGGGKTERFTRTVDRPSPTITGNGTAWRWERPSTTVQGDLRVAPPGHHEHTREPDSIPVTTEELGVLQGFPADHPWQAPGRASQVGNAIPPPLAEACLRAVA